MRFLPLYAAYSVLLYATFLGLQALLCSRN